MKVKVTVTGTLELDKSDMELLKKASPGEVLDTMRYQAKGMKAEIGTPKKPKAVQVTVKGPDLTPARRAPNVQEPED